MVTHSLTHSLTYLLTHSYTSLTHSLTYSLTHSLSHSLTYSLTHSLTHSRRCHNSVATFSLCLLAQVYDLSSCLIQKFAQVDVTVGFLMQIDKLVQLLESPIFINLRLQLLEVIHLLTYSLTYLLTYLLTHSLAHSLTYFFRW